MLSFFPRDVLYEIWDLIKSVSEGFPTTPIRDIKYINVLVDNCRFRLIV